MPFSSSINLQLPEVPDAVLKPELALAISPLHYSIHALHKGVSFATGTWQPSAAEFPTIVPQQSLLAGNHRKIYLVAAVAITAGQLIYINGAGQAALSSTAVLGTIARGFCVQSVAAGATGEFVLFEGLLAIAGATAGTRYYANDAAGTIGVAAGTVPQLVGIGVAANLIYIRIAMQ